VSLNTYKPFACGIVIHPSIDGCIQLRNAHRLTSDKIRRVVLRVHPLVLELTGKKTPRDGLEGKFSVYHSCAAGLIHGRAGEDEYSDEVVNAPEVMALRARVEAIVDPSVPEDAADVQVETNDGRSVHVHVEHAIGSLERPMSDAQLRAKFIDQSAPVLGAERAARAADIASRMAEFSSVKELIASCTGAR
jgi:2-methylcitrate dehydratase PrpD